MKKFLLLLAVSLPLAASAKQVINLPQISAKERNNGVAPAQMSQVLFTSPAAAEASTFSLTITDQKLGGSVDQYNPVVVLGVDSDFSTEVRWDASANSASVSLAPGTYDVAVPVSVNGSKGWVIRENVELTSDRTLSVAASECTYVVTFSPVDANGARFEGPVYDYYQTFSVVDGPVKAGSGYIFLCHEKYAQFWMNLAELGIFDFGPDGQISMMDEQKIAISPNTRFSLTGIYVLHTDQGQYLVHLGSKGHGTQTLTNDPADYKTIDLTYVPSPLAEVDAEMAHEYFATIIDDEVALVGGCTLRAAGAKNDRFFLCVDDDNDAKATLALIPKIDEYTEEGLWSSTSYSLYCPPVMVVDGKARHIATGSRTGEVSDYFTRNSAGAQCGVSNQHSTWAFDHPETALEVGGTCPTFQSIPLISAGSGTPDFTYIGRVDDVHELDVYKSLCKVEKDGETVFEGTYSAYKNYWKNAPAGAYTVTVENSNVAVDGLSGYNYTTQKFDMSASDPIAPSVAALRFVDANNVITDRFDNAEDGSFMLAAADYVMGVNGKTYINASAPKSVTVEYAPNDTEDFEPLTVETDNEVFESGYGTLYKGSLKQVNRSSANTWYDLRITVADEAGNTSTQIISPAFKAVTPAGIMKVNADDPAIFTNSAITLYNTAGVMVGTYGNGSIDASTLAPGVYIARSGSKASKILVK